LKIGVSRVLTEPYSCSGKSDFGFYDIEMGGGYVTFYAEIGLAERGNCYFTSVNILSVYSL
jgi:hypothetical protein